MVLTPTNQQKSKDVLTPSAQAQVLLNKTAPSLAVNMFEPALSFPLYYLELVSTAKTVCVTRTSCVCVHAVQIFRTAIGQCTYK